MDHEGLEQTMTDTLLPPAADWARKLALAESEDAAKQSRALQEAERQKKELLDQLSNPSGVSDEQAIQRTLAMIEGAVKNCRTEVQIYRFPNQLCTDSGRAINQGEQGWQATLTGVPREIYELYERHFRDKGYKLKVEIADFPNGKPGDVAMTLVWADGH